MKEPETLYKLMILYMLKKVNFPMTNPQLWTFFEEKGYTNYFTFQDTVAELLDANLVSHEEIRNSVLYEITREGEEALFYFNDEIADSIREEMDEYIRVNKYQLRNETGITADYKMTENYDYCVHLLVREGKSILFEMNLTVPTEEQARILSEHWEENSQNIYAYVLKRLM
ncbi:MAG: DUF4364 family protein [Lachnospiraceae bacterium]|nr:DUF4364 family protein [Lachnospiraceae bacterium]